MRIAIWAGDADRAEPQDRLAALDAAMAAAARHGAELLLVPEAVGAAAPAPHRAALAEPSDGPMLLGAGALAARHGVALACSFLEACSGRLHSSLVVIDAQGMALGCYRRCHVSGAEERWLARGAWLTIVPWRERRLGLLIGYDLRFPEPARALALAGADALLVAGSAACGPPAQAGLLAAARALENGVPVALALPGAAPPDHAAFAPQGRPLAVIALPAGLCLVALPPPDPAGAAQLSDRHPALYRRLAPVDG